MKSHEQISMKPAGQIDLETRSSRLEFRGFDPYLGLSLLHW